MQRNAGPEPERTGQATDGSRENLVEGEDGGRAGQEAQYAQPGGLLRRAFALIDRNLAYVLPAPAAIVILLLMGYPSFIQFR